MVALVKRKDVKGLAQRLAHGSPIFERAKKTMQDDERVAFSIAFEVEIHSWGEVDWRDEPSARSSLEDTEGRSENGGILLSFP